MSKDMPVGHTADRESPAERMPGEQAVRDQLDRLVRSVHFRNSKRYPTLLRFVVEKTLTGAADELKERTLGVEVFGRRPDYDTNADPVVRFTAGEIRKRLAQYYLMPEHAQELRFELPLGSYVPHFSAFQAPKAEARREAATEVVPYPRLEPHSLEPWSAPSVQPFAFQQAQPDGPAASGAARRTPRSRPGRSLVATVACVLALGTAVAWLTTLWIAHGRLGAGTSFFWKPLLRSRLPCMIVLGVHTLGADGVDRSPLNDAPDTVSPASMLTDMLRSDMVPVSDVVSYGYLTDLLARNNRSYTTRSASDTTFREVRGQPLILVGGFDNIWTMRLTRNLRFRFVPDEQMAHSIVDREHPERHWTFDSAQSTRSNSEDYGILASFFDPEIEQNVVVIAGIGRFGTEAAAEFATSARSLGRVGSEASSHRHNFEVLLSTSIIEGHHGPPHIVAEDTW